MLGVPQYEPRFFTSTTDLLALHGARFRALISQRIHETWVVWHLNDDAWFPDCPVVLNVGQHQLEVCAWKIGELAISWSLIDVSQPLNWYGAGTEIPLQWKQNALPPLVSAVHARIQAIHMIEHYSLLHGLQFTLSTGYLTIFNGLDENAVSGEVLVGDEYRKIPV